MNRWDFTGEVVRIQEHTYHDFGATLTVRGVAERSNEAATNIIETQFTIPAELYHSAKKDGLKTYSNVEMQGHLESWATDSGKNYRIKLRLIVDFLKLTS